MQTPPLPPDNVGPDPWPRRLFGRSPGRTVFKLVLASVVVGLVLAVVGVSPMRFWRSIFDALKSIVSLLGNTVGEVVANLATYLFFGAAIVVPVWLVSRLLSGRRDRGP
jgi:hypothetical protein